MSGPIQIAPRLVLLRAADLLRSDGWIQHAHASPHGYCVLGAVRMAADQLVPHRIDPVVWSNLVRRADDMLALKLGHSVGGGPAVRLSVAGWNDWPARTAEEAIALLESTATEPGGE